VEVGRKGSKQARPNCAVGETEITHVERVWPDLRSLAAEPVVDLFPQLILRIPVTRLNFAFELIPVPIDLGNLVIGEAASLLLYLAGELLPIAFDAVPIHGVLLLGDERSRLRESQAAVGASGRAGHSTGPL
jgi:hypothetical protein